MCFLAQFPITRLLSLNTLCNPALEPVDLGSLGATTCELDVADLSREGSLEVLAG
jgi:hypothetical protein